MGGSIFSIIIFFVLLILYQIKESKSENDQANQLAAEEQDRNIYPRFFGGSIRQAQRNANQLAAYQQGIYRNVDVAEDLRSPEEARIEANKLAKEEQYYHGDLVPGVVTTFRDQPDKLYTWSR